jgi:hypothetical protein
MSDPAETTIITSPFIVCRGLERAEQIDAAVPPRIQRPASKSVLPV